MTTPELRNKKIGNRMESEFRVHLNISLEELNHFVDPRTGMTAGEDHLHRFNSNVHRFTHENQVGKRWVPDTVWNEYLTENSENLIQFQESHVEKLRVYGYRKFDRVIDIKGVITHDKKRYFVEDKTLWNSQESTKVTVSVINDCQLAIFERGTEGQILTRASLLPETQKSEKQENSEKAKVKKRENTGLEANILKSLKDYDITPKISTVHQLIGLGLSLALTGDILEQQKQRYAQTPQKLRFSLFKSDAEKSLKGVDAILKSMQKVVTFAGGNSE